MAYYKFIIIDVGIVFYSKNKKEKLYGVTYTQRDRMDLFCIWPFGTTKKNSPAKRSTK